jgi:uncharacterized protein with NRDE domain
MCLIAFAWKTHPGYPLVLVANRDEFHARPSLPARPWEDDPDIIGGRDLQANGSWLAISKTGRFAAVTNFREGTSEPSELSRGSLVQDFLQSTKSAEQFNLQLEEEKQLYGGYNLLLASDDEIFYCSNRSDLATNLTPGIYSLSNHLLDSPWPKALYAKQQLSHIIEADSLEPRRLLAMMRHATPFEDELLPSTGVSLEMERTLSPPFIQTETYGTRCTTVLLWDNDSNTRLIEQNYLASGEPGERIDHHIDLTS